MSNIEVCQIKRPKGWPEMSDFEVKYSTVPTPGDGEILLKILYLSVDPYMRGRMNDTKSYVPPFELGKPMQGGIVAKVEKSNSDKFTEGDYVVGMGNWAEYMVTDGGGFIKVDPSLAPLSYYLGILGMPGQTAWVGLTAVAGLKKGQNVYVSAASGAVGQVVGQIAKNMGCHVSGSAGDDAKVAYLKELGFDAAFNYKTADNLNKALAEANPKGIDVYFENVGGPMLEAVLNNMNMFGRIAVCGMIADYNAKSASEVSTAPRNMTQMIGKAIRMEGFIVSYYPDACKEWLGVCAEWLKDGKISYKESMVEGIENAPQGFLDMLSGKNFGKQVIKVADD
ncbi:NADP-dependent oxidoreductase [Kordiimonas sediminis]|uniref:NADP-dependent oxidoreductase n=1 Tax=Kordiimonas sediminis TaxID=1735581 RepID=A0A919AVX8_9PROT|nr:NADP-dependent oxidoreductase [Kordiimonas sediminis]